jgi:hypothetical protein
MSWEALRLTSRTPSEIYHVMGPGGVDGLVRQVLTTCWTALPSEQRNFDQWLADANDVFARNMRVWDGLEHPTPEDFFRDLRPEPQDGFMRQAMVLCYMMLPRGHKNVANVRRVVTDIFQRNLAGWASDNQVFLHGPAAPARRTKAKAKPSKRKAAKKKRSRRK